jgi:O-methyltransferase
MKSAIAKLARAAGYEIRKAGKFRNDFDDFERRVIRRVEPYTMTSPERIVAVIDATRYIVRADIAGVFIECGVWRGGSTMAAALTLLELKAKRELYLFDTFEGMSEPTEHDRKAGGPPAMELFSQLRTKTGSSWNYASIDDVRNALAGTGYPLDLVHLVKGKVEDTVPGHAPQRIALLRLDTDWYESTKHELAYLYPRLVGGGVLIVDDYGSWEGARKAVDEYFVDKPILFSRSDGQGRIAVKPLGGLVDAPPVS